MLDAAGTLASQIRVESKVESSAQAALEFSPFNKPGEFLLDFARDEIIIK